MIKPIVKDIFFLRRKAETATREDIQVGIDLQDTLRANREACDHCKYGICRCGYV